MCDQKLNEEDTQRIYNNGIIIELRPIIKRANQFIELN